MKKLTLFIALALAAIPIAQAMPSADITLDQIATSQIASPAIVESGGVIAIAVTDNSQSAVPIAFVISVVGDTAGKSDIPIAFVVYMTDVVEQTSPADVPTYTASLTSLNFSSEIVARTQNTSRAPAVAVKSDPFTLESPVVRRV